MKRKPTNYVKLGGKLLFTLKILIFMTKDFLQLCSFTCWVVEERLAGVFLEILHLKGEEGHYFHLPLF